MKIEDSSQDDIPFLNLGINISEECVIVVIKTQFDPEDPVNKQLSFQDYDADFILKCIMKERKKAKNALERV